MCEEGVRSGSRTAPWAGVHPGKVMTFRGWGRGRLPHLGAGANPRGRHLLRWVKGGGVSPRPGTRCSRTPAPLAQSSEPWIWTRFPPPAEPHAATESSQSLALTCGHRCTRRAWSRVGRGRENRLLLPPAQVLPSPGRLRSRRQCPLLQCESRRRRAGPGPGRPGNRDSTWRRALRCRAHPLSAPSRGAAPPAQPRRRAKEAGGYVAAVTRYAGPPPGTRVAAERREVRQPSRSARGRGCGSV